MLPIKPQPTHLYHVTFEDYLQPKKPQKQHKLIFDSQLKNNAKAPQLRLKLLEHPAAFISHDVRSTKKVRQLLNKIKTATTESTPKTAQTTINESVANTAKLWQLKAKLNRVAHHPSWPLQLPSCLAFLRARNDDGLCKRKSGFEIYCEMASIHGFANFVGATTWQRALWCFIISVAILMSFAILVMSHLHNVDSPTIMYTESTHHPTWTIAFPAVTICNLNRVSHHKSMQLAQKFQHNSVLSTQQQLNLFRKVYYTDFHTTSDYKTLQELLLQNNYTLSQLQEVISVNCVDELLRCKWKGRIERCSKLFQKVVTPQGNCCSFNYHAHWSAQRENSPHHTTSCSYKTGLTILLDPQLSDYMASGIMTPGYQVLIHNAHDYPANSVERQFVPARTETIINVTPQNTYATEYLRSENLQTRRCYFPAERELETFAKYTQTNCLVGCRNQMLAHKCGCVPEYMSHITRNVTKICDLSDAACLWQHNDILHRLLVQNNLNYKVNRSAESFICDCFPECSFDKYISNMDSTALNRTFALGDRRFFNGINTTNHILLHVFYGELVAQKLRVDVYENWLSFVGTFGGITGLFMGYSFVSGFEMIFFVFVRPLCNWLTRKQILYKIKRRQKKAAALATAKKAQEAEVEKHSQTNEGAQDK